MPDEKAEPITRPQSTQTKPPEKPERKKPTSLKKLCVALEALTEEQTVALFTHRMPDPDAIASMMGMKWFLYRKYNIEAEIFFDGEVAHPQNMVVCNLLDPGMRRVSEEYDPKNYHFNILCDTIPENAGTGKHDVKFDVVIDHHKDLPHEYDGVFIHYKCGSCAAIVYDIIKQVITTKADNWFDDDIDYDQKVATAMIAGIMTDCNFMLSDDTTEYERHAFSELFEYRHSGFLHQIVFFKRPKFWIDKKAEGCTKASVDEGFAVVGLGIIPEKQRDLIADMAEEMVQWTSVETAIAFAVVGGDRIEGSVRSLNASMSVPEFCKKLGGEHGTGGGKRGKGAYRLPLAGMSIDPDDGEDDIKEEWDFIRKKEAKRIQKAIKK